MLEKAEIQYGGGYFAALSDIPGVMPYSRRISTSLQQEHSQLPKYIYRRFSNGLAVLSMKHVTLVPCLETYKIGVFVQSVLENANKESLVLDIGTGTGLLALLLSLKNTTVTATDIHSTVLDIAKFNFAINEIPHANLVLSDGFENPSVSGTYDLIISNPPFFTSGKYSGNSFEPDFALNGGSDGMDIYRKIIYGSRGRLTSEGGLILQVQELSLLRVLRILKDAYPNREHRYLMHKGKACAIATGSDFFLHQYFDCDSIIL